MIMILVKMNHTKCLPNLRLNVMGVSQPPKTQHGAAFRKLKHVASEGQKKKWVNATFVALEICAQNVFLAVLKSASIHQLEGNLWIIPNDF